MKKHTPQHKQGREPTHLGKAPTTTATPSAARHAGSAGVVVPTSSVVTKSSKPAASAQASSCKGCKDVVLQLVLSHEPLSRFGPASAARAAVIAAIADTLAVPRSAVRISRIVPLSLSKAGTHAAVLALQDGGATRRRLKTAQTQFRVHHVTYNDAGGVAAASAGAGASAAVGVVVTASVRVADQPAAFFLVTEIMSPMTASYLATR